MTLTAVIPTHNSASTIIRAVESVQNQTWPVDQIIVVDDGSTDGSYDLLQKLRIPTLTVIRTENRGVESARNTGIKHSTSTHIAFLDSDDIWEAAKCEKQMRLLSEVPSLAATSTYGYYLINGRKLGGIRIGFTCREGLEHARKNGKPIWMLTPSVIVRKDVLEEVGMFRPCFGGAAEDLDLWTRIAYAYDVLTVPESLVGVQMRAGSASMRKQLKMEQNTLYIREYARATAARTDIISYAEFQKKLSDSPWWLKLKASLLAFGSTQFREGSFHLLSGRRVSGICKLLIAAAINPRSFYKKVRNQAVRR